MGGGIGMTWGKDHLLWESSSRQQSPNIESRHSYAISISMNQDWSQEASGSVEYDGMKETKPKRHELLIDGEMRDGPR